MPSEDVVEILAVDEAVTTSTGTGGFGLTEKGFVAKPYARLLAEKLATARVLFGADLDLTAGSVLRKLLEVTALEDARTWAALSSWYDNSFIGTAHGVALDRLGEELGLPRPYEQAHGQVALTLAGQEPITLRRGARLLSSGGHHAALAEPVELSVTSRQRTAAVVAFYPGPEHNLEPSARDGAGRTTQKLERWHPDDQSLDALFDLERRAGGPVVTISHTEPLTGGELRWPDARYRELLLRAPRSLWRADAIELVVSLIPGVRQVAVRDPWGGLDLSESIFGDFHFMERVFTGDRDFASPYFVTVLVAPTPAAIWNGPDGLRAAVLAEIEDVRPISIYARVEQAEQVGIGLSGLVSVEGLPLPSGSAAVINASAPARALKARLLERVRRYLDNLPLGQPVRASEVLYALMSEPGVADVTNLALLRYPPGVEAIDLRRPDPLTGPQTFGQGANVVLQPSQVPLLIDDDSRLVVG